MESYTTSTKSWKCLDLAGVTCTHLQAKCHAVNIYLFYIRLEGGRGGLVAMAPVTATTRLPHSPKFSRVKPGHLM